MIENFSFLSAIIILPFMGMLFTLFSREDADNDSNNAFHVAFFAICANLVLVLRVLSNMNLQKTGLQLVERFNWLETPDIDIILGADIFSIVTIMSVHFAFLIGLFGVQKHKHMKSMMIFSLLFLGTLTGFFLSADIFSFYIFFESMLFPLFMLIGIFGDIRRDGIIYRFFLYNFFGAVLLFLAIIMLFNFHDGFLEISKYSGLKHNSPIGYFVLIAIFIACLSRIPIWPFHYWISSISSNIRSPLVFILTNLLPLTGLYGFMRFLPNHQDALFLSGVTLIEFVAIITMLFIALIGFTNRDVQYKLFSYITVYYMMYLISLLNANNMTNMNIAFSGFAFILITSFLSILSGYLHFEQDNKGISPDGILCPAPKISFVYSFFILASMGLPVSSLFVNNFLLVSQIMEHNLYIGLVVVICLTLVAGALLKDYYRLKDRSRVSPDKPCIKDISGARYIFGLFIMFVLLYSSLKPLWFLGT